MPTYLAPGVFVEETDSGARPIEGVGTAVAAFVGFAGQGPLNTPTLVTSWPEYTKTFGEFVDGGYLAHAVYAYFLNGGGTCYVVRVGGATDGDGNGASAAITPGPQAALGSYRVRLKEVPPAGKPVPEITVEVIAPPPADDGSVPADRFGLNVSQGGTVVETFANVSNRRGKDFVATVVNEQSKLITIDDPGGSLTAPALGTVTLQTPALPPPAPVQISADDYVGDMAERTGVGGLDAVDEITMLAAPDLMGAYERGAIDLDGVKVVQTAMINHCELMGDRMAILDPPPDMSAQQVKEWRSEHAGYDSRYAALYYPWVQVFDPASGTQRLLPPSGHVAGIWARSDDTRGVHKAPANEVVRGAVGLAGQVTRGEQELLNPIGVNCIRAFAGRGIRVWGARTLSSDPAWRYVNVRRLFNYLEESILDGTQWVVFEPNDDALWARIRRTISAFLVNEWRRGALFGLTPAEAFFVRCDRVTNPAEAIDAGQVTCEIGVAPVKPAEFVVFRLSQLSGGTSMVAE